MVQGLPLFKLARCLAAVLIVAAFTAPAASQSQTFGMSDDEWVLEREPEPGSDDAVMADARRALANDNPGLARRILNDWIRENDRSGKEQLPLALRLRGDARVALNDEYNALYDYEAVIRRFPQSEEFVIAIERELEIAIRYAFGLRRKFLGLRIDDASDLAVEILIRVQERLPGSVLAERAAIELADFYYRRREMKEAAEAYELYLLNFPNGPNRMRAKERRIYASIARFRGPEHDASGLVDASLQIESFAAEFPAEAERQGLNSALMSRLEESAAAHMLDSAQWYLRTRDDPSARLTLRRLVRRHPQTVAASRGMDILEARGWLEDGAPGITTPDDGPGEADATGAERDAGGGS
ncbi:MAG: outer membrane protein assembly factor BamD [Phycisphaerales bacterium]|nr:MAG: outer membrane protein assembly factor BamD [Phycisphaerales bacterium]